MLSSHIRRIPLRNTPRLYRTSPCTVTPFRRNFSTTPYRNAEDVPTPIDEKPTTPVSKLANNPEALKAIKDFGKKLDALNGGKPPNKFQIIRGFFNAELRESALKVGRELSKAGVSLDSKELMEEMMKLKKIEGDDK